jgi:hypothetical protein
MTDQELATPTAVITTEDANAAMTRGRSIGSSLSNRLMAGQAVQRELFELVQQRFQTPLGQVEAAGLLDVVAGTVLACKSVAQLAVTNAHQATSKAVAEACGDALLEVLQEQHEKAHAAYRSYMAGVDVALRQVYEQMVAVIPTASRINVPPLPTPPAKPKRIAFDFNEAGDIVGATLH